MTSKTYTIEHQRLVTGRGYVACEPHRACRVAIKEITSFRRNGQRYRTERTYRIFSGTAASLQARMELDRLIGGAKSMRAKQERKIWGRSLTIAEYDELMNSKREEGSY